MRKWWVKFDILNFVIQEILSPLVLRLTFSIVDVSLEEIVLVRTLMLKGKLKWKHASLNNVGLSFEIG